MARIGLAPVLVTAALGFASVAFSAGAHADNGQGNWGGDLVPNFGHIPNVGDMVPNWHGRH